MRFKLLSKKFKQKQCSFKKQYCCITYTEFDKKICSKSRNKVDLQRSGYKKCEMLVAAVPNQRKCRSIYELEIQKQCTSYPYAQKHPVYNKLYFRNLC